MLYQLKSIHYTRHGPQGSLRMLPSDAPLRCSPQMLPSNAPLKCSKGAADCSPKLFKEANCLP